MGDLVFQSKKSKILGLLTILVLLAALAVAYPKWNIKEDTKNPVTPQVGVIDMNKAIKAHPKYQQLAALEQQYKAIAAKAEADARTSISNLPQQGYSPDIGTPVANSAGIGAALEQEYKVKMAEKKKQLDEALNAKAAKAHQNVSAEHRAYSDELDKTYQPQIFSLQLKIKTVQLAKEEMAALQSELDKLQNERGTKLAAKERELAVRLDQTMAPEKAAAEQQLAAYSNVLNQELAAKGGAQKAEIAARNQQSTSPVPKPSDITGQKDAEQQLAMKKQEIDAFTQAIIDDIRDKAGKVAVARGLDTVLANAKVNVAAVDITSAVIGEFNSVQRPGLN